MADPKSILEFDPRLNAPEVQGPPTPLQGFTGSLGLVPSFQEAGAKRIEGLKTSAARGRSEVEELKTTAAEQEKAAKAARPEPLELKPPPSLEARPFLMPGKGFLNELQTAIVGATQMVLGVGGLKGRGHAIAAVAGLKGALEGWQAGDRERADASLREWQAASKALLENHRSRREFYQDLLTDQQRSMDTRLREIGIQARIDGQEDLARAAEQGQIGDLINILGQRETANQQFEIRMKTLENSIDQHRETAARQDRFHADLERQRGIVNQRLERSAKFREESSKALSTLQGQETSLTQRIDNAAVVREAVDLLDKEGILPKGATVWDKAKATLALQTKPGRADIAQAVQVVQRLGTPLVVGTEVGLGTTGSVLRLKVVGEAEAGNLLGAPKQFWDLFLPAATKKWEADRAIAREHLRRMDRLPADREWTAEPVE